MAGIQSPKDLILTCGHLDHAQPVEGCYSSGRLICAKSKLQIPNHKYQKSQPKIRNPIVLVIVLWEIEVYLEFGAWVLGFLTIRR